MKKIRILSTAALALTIISGAAWASETHGQGGHDGMSMNNHGSSQQQMGIQATGKLNSVNIKKHKVNITHGPIPALSWPPMRMDFAVKKGVSLSALKPGQKVHFSMMKSGEYEYMITKISPVR
ncbi:MAG: copper-binding protein [Magnetococcales bacterium]|nr:copper-binding protein [Magnetococcales bacterium]